MIGRRALVIVGVAGLALMWGMSAQAADGPTTGTTQSAKVAVPRAPRARLSPHETISRVIDKNRITITYGRPYAMRKGTTEVRKIWGALVPWDNVWRLGADEATTLITQEPIMIGDKEIAAGAYTLFMLPKEGSGSQLIISKELGQWGLEYHEAQDKARVALKEAEVDGNVEQFTITIDPKQGGGGELKFTWESKQYSVPVKVSEAP